MSESYEYRLQIPEFPDLPNELDFDEKDKVLLENVFETIYGILTPVIDILNKASHDNLPYAKETAIVINVFAKFCEALKPNK